MRAMREGVARQSVEKPPRNAQMGGGRAEKPRETRESKVGRRSGAEKPRETREWAAAAARQSHARHAKGWRGGAAGRKSHAKPRKWAAAARKSHAKPRKWAASQRGKTPRNARKHGGAARKSPLRGARMGGVAVRGKYPAKPREWAAGGKAPAKRAGGRRSAESPSAKRANGWKKPPPAKCAEEGERMSVYAFSDAARSCASGSLRLLTALQACMTKATAMTP